MMHLQSIFDRILPQSIVARMTVILFLGILVAQGMGIWIWGQQLKTEERLRISEVSMNMGARIGQTIQFFSKLPREYRHIVLDQLRDMGGTRYFVSINSQKIHLETLPNSKLQQLVGERVKQNAARQLAYQSEDFAVEFVAF